MQKERNENTYLKMKRLPEGELITQLRNEDLRNAFEVELVLKKRNETELKTGLRSNFLNGEVHSQYSKIE